MNDKPQSIFSPPVNNVRFQLKEVWVAKLKPPIELDLSALEKKLAGHTGIKFERGTKDSASLSVPGDDGKSHTLVGLEVNAEGKITRLYSVFDPLILNYMLQATLPEKDFASLKKAIANSDIAGDTDPLSDDLKNKIKAIDRNVTDEEKNKIKKDIQQYDEFRKRSQEALAEIQKLPKTSSKIDVTADNSIGVGTGEYYIISDPDNKQRHVLGSRKADHCVIMAVYNPKTKATAVAHIDSTVPMKDVTELLEKMKKDADGAKVQIHLTGGLRDCRIAEIADTVKNSGGTEIKSAKVNYGIHCELAIDGRTGEVRYSREADKDSINDLYEGRAHHVPGFFNKLKPIDSDWYDKIDAPKPKKETPKAKPSPNNPPGLSDLGNLSPPSVYDEKTIPKGKPSYSV